MNKSKWIWYPGNYELYHGMRLHNRRTSAHKYRENIKSVYYYPMWRVDGPVRNTSLTKTATISQNETIEFYANTDLASIIVDYKSYPVGAVIELTPGEHTVTVQGYKEVGFPAFYIRGDVFASDRTYTLTENEAKAGRCAGWSDLYTDLNSNPEVLDFKYEEFAPVLVENINGGTLFDFGREMFGFLKIESIPDHIKNYTVFLGESREEATDTEYSLLVIDGENQGGCFKTRNAAFRYAFLPFEGASMTATLEYLPIESLGSFKCENEELNRLWSVCEYTMLLNSREGFLDGIKRDGWVWSGDAYQSYFVNYYLGFDREIVKRSIRMLRGSDPIRKHINTICDYTFLWFSSIYEYYFYTGDKEFLEDIYPEMLDMWSFVSSRLDKDGLYQRIPDDWVFIDWHTFDSNGPICAEQMVLARALSSLSLVADALGDKERARAFSRHHSRVKKALSKYWDDEKGAFIDDYKSGKRNVTRHANIFALLFGYATDDEREQIVKNVIYNKEIAPITTPYFEFFELDAMCRLGDFDYFYNMLDNYFCGMLRLGATTIWEEFDPKKSGIEHYEMYGGKYEKSLCHAWGASPIYLLGKYVLGVTPTLAGYEKFEVKPCTTMLKEFSGDVPTPNGCISVSLNDKEVSVFAPFDGGTLVLNGKRYKIKANKKLVKKI